MNLSPCRRESSEITSPARSSGRTSWRRAASSPATSSSRTRSRRAPPGPSASSSRSSTTERSGSRRSRTRPPGWTRAGATTRGCWQCCESSASRGQRRVIKSHLPADALPIAAEARYLFVGRNGKDLGIEPPQLPEANFSPETMATINRIHAEWSGDPSPLVIPESMQEFFDLWLDTDGYGCCDLFDVVKSWWKLRDEPNVLLVHYRQLKDDLRGQIARIAKFIGVDPAVAADGSHRGALLLRLHARPRRGDGAVRRRAHERSQGVLPQGAGPRLPRASSPRSRSSASIGWPRRSWGATAPAGWRPARSRDRLAAPSGRLSSRPGRVEEESARPRGG